MNRKQPYHIVASDKKAERRDCSKVSGHLELPDLVEVQTDSFEWFKNEGTGEVFNEVYPIQSYGGNIKLKFAGYEFGEPKFNAGGSMYRECSPAAPLKARMELEIIDNTASEVISRWEDVFPGDFPLVTETSTFIIDGAKRVIVSQIVHSPGTYFSAGYEKRTEEESFAYELIPSRGTWLEFLTEMKKTSTGCVLNMSINRKRKMLSSILFKAIGMSVDSDRSEDVHDMMQIKTFLKAMGRDIVENVAIDDEDREFMNLYPTLYASFFGRYEEIENTLMADRAKTTQEALLSIYENQHSNEIPTLDGSITSIDTKFFDPHRYDLTKAGHYKLRKKLNVIGRVDKHHLAQDILDADGSVFVLSGAVINRGKRNALRKELEKGMHVNVFSFSPLFNYPDKVYVPNNNHLDLVGHVPADDVELEDGMLYEGSILSEQGVEAIVKDAKKVAVHGGIVTKKVALTSANVNAVLNYGQGIHAFARLTDANGEGVVDGEGDFFVDDYTPRHKPEALSVTAIDEIRAKVNNGVVLYVWLVRATIQEILIHGHDGAVMRTMGNDPYADKHTTTTSDMCTFYAYSLNNMEGVGDTDDIDILGNRRVRSVGELVQNQFRIGLSHMERVAKERMSIADIATLAPKKLTSIRPLTAAVREFFSSLQLSQLMDQQSPLVELTNEHRTSTLGPGGIAHDRASYKVRGVHSSHYGRICPVETPRSPNTGLISNLTTYGRINKYGFIQTPHRIMDADGTVQEEVLYLSADEEAGYVIAQTNKVVEGHLINEHVVTRKAGDTIIARREEVELTSVSPKQIVPVATACVPFLKNDDASHILMGADMQCQAVPLLQLHSPYVGTGVEFKIAKDSGVDIVARGGGVVEYTDSQRIIVNENDGNRGEYRLRKFQRSNNGTNINQSSIISRGKRIEKDNILADGPSMERGKLALGQNVTIAYMTQYGYNYEDAITMSERSVHDDVYTSIHIEECNIDYCEIKLGSKEITRDAPNVSGNACRNLDSRGIIMVGTEVMESDILVGKVTPRGQSEISLEEKLLLIIFDEKSREVRDNSLKVLHDGAGIAHSIRVFKRSEGYDLLPGVNETVKVYIVQERKISEGDKIAGHHGNKGVTSKILPVEDMPYMPDGAPVDIMLNPFGVPSRMNIGQVLETHLGYVARKLGVKFSTPVFDGINNIELSDIMEEAEITINGEQVLYDDHTGEPFDGHISVGVMYMIKLAHMVDDKLHACIAGPYPLITQQPLGGKAQNGGQRFGEMEVWALEAYGAAHTLQEIPTVKSGDTVGRTKTYEAIIKGKDIPEPGVPESPRVLERELRALVIDVKMLDEDGNEVDISKEDNSEAAATLPPIPAAEPIGEEDINDLEVEEGDAVANDESEDEILLDDDAEADNFIEDEDVKLSDDENEEEA